MTLRSQLKEFFGIADVDSDTRRAALQEPGPTWTQWAKGPFSKAYLALGFFIGDTLLLVTGLQPTDPLILLSLVPVLYLEFIAWQYLWYRPDPNRESRVNAFHPTPFHPVRFGRWTPEGERAQAGVDPFGNANVGPNPDEFL